MEIIPKAQGSSSVNGREKYVKSIYFTIITVRWSHRPVVCGITFCAGGSGGAGSNPGRANSSFFFFSFLQGRTCAQISPEVCFRFSIYLSVMFPRTFLQTNVLKVLKVVLGLLAHVMPSIFFSKILSIGVKL